MPVLDVLRAQLNAAIWECCPPTVAGLLAQSQILAQVSLALEEDARAFAAKDPAAEGDVLTVVQAYTSYRAVLHYRLAHAVAGCARVPGLEDAAPYAALISSRGKLLSGAELDHRCRIGRRFVLDHGTGTVIGETAEIGDDCYFLGGVTLGAFGIAGNPSGKRHPSIGHRVQIGAFSRIFGPLQIGDEAFIGPHCTITQDIAPRSRVILRTSVQVVTASDRIPAMTQ